MTSGRSKYFGFHITVLEYMGLGIFNKRINDTRKRYLYNMIQMGVMVALTLIIFSDVVMVIDIRRSSEGMSKKLFFAVNTQNIHLYGYIKFLVFIYNKKIIERVITSLETETLRFKRYADVETRTAFVSKLITYSLFVMSFMTISSMSFYSLITSKELPFPIYIPWDHSGKWSYVGAYVYCVTGIVWLATVIILTDTFMASILINIAGQLRMVRRTVENTGKDTVDKLISELNDRHGNVGRFGENDLDPYDYTNNKDKLMAFYTPEEFNYCICAHLKRGIQNHQLILRIVNDFHKAYTYGFFFQVISSISTIGLVLIELASVVKEVPILGLFNSFGFLSSALTQLFIQTYSADKITTEAEKIATCVYNLPWYDAEDRGSVKTLTMILMNMTQRPLFIRAANHKPMTNQLFISILNMSYQIFTVIMSRM